MSRQAQLITAQSRRWLARLNTWRRTRGQGLVEYALLLSLIALVCVPVVYLLGNSLGTTFQNINCVLDGTQEGCSCEYYEVITVGPDYTCVTDMFAFRSLTNCGDKTNLSLELDAGTGSAREISLAYDAANNVFSSISSEPALCSVLASGGSTPATLISRHTEDPGVNRFAVTLSGSSETDDGDDGEGDGSGDDSTGGDTTGDDTTGDDTLVANNPTTCPALVESAFTALDQNCGDLGLNNACYGYNYVFATFTQAMPSEYFTMPADRTPLQTLRTVRTAAFDPSVSQWGLAVMSVQANLPNTIPGQRVVLLLVGDGTLTNDVDPNDALFTDVVVSVTVQRQVNVRSEASTTANSLGMLSAGVQRDVHGIDPSGDWLRLWHNGVPAWVPASAVTPASSLAALPVVSDEMYSPMQAFRLDTNHTADLTCGNVPNTLLVQNPEGTQTTLRVNNTNLTIGSTVAIRTDDTSGLTEVFVLDGSATVNGVTVSTCERGVISGGSWTDVRAMTVQEQADFQVLEGLPPSALNYPVDVCGPASPPPSVPPVESVPVLWAGAQTCNNTLQWSGSDNTFSGSVHSNRDIQFGGGTNRIYGNTTYVTSVNGSANYYQYPYPTGASGNPPQQVTAQNDPINVDISRFAPGGDLALAAQARGEYYYCNCKMDKNWMRDQGLYDEVAGTLRDGIYYSAAGIDDAIEVSDGDITGVGGNPARVTFVAENGGIKFNGSDLQFEPYVGPDGLVGSDTPALLAFSNRQFSNPGDRCGNWVVDFSGSTHIWSGIVYAPHGQVKISGSSTAVVRGALVAHSIQMSGSNLSISADASLYP